MDANDTNGNVLNVAFINENKEEAQQLSMNESKKDAHQQLKSLPLA